jgi:hypothetical protein
LKAGNRRLASDAARAVITNALVALRRKPQSFKEVAAKQALELCCVRGYVAQKPLYFQIVEKGLNIYTPANLTPLQL